MPLELTACRPSMPYIQWWLRWRWAYSRTWGQETRRKHSYCGSPNLSRKSLQTNHRHHRALMPWWLLRLCTLGTERLSRLRHRHLHLLLITELSNCHPWAFDRSGSNELRIATYRKMRSVDSTQRAPTPDYFLSWPFHSLAYWGSAWRPLSVGTCSHPMATIHETTIPHWIKWRWTSPRPFLISSQEPHSLLMNVSKIYYFRIIFYRV